MPALLSVVLLSHCADPEPASQPPPTIDETELSSELDGNEQQPLEFASVAQRIQQSASEQLTQMTAACSQMRDFAESFIDEPSNEAQGLARDAYLDCYHRWLGLSLYFQVPFDLSETREFERRMDLIDTRPYLAGYIGSVPDYPFSGLVHELDIPVTLNNLLGQHRLMDEDSASLGFPAVEFFLWRNPLNDAWIANGENNELVERRKQFLSLALRQLLVDLTWAQERWQPAGPFERLPERAKLSAILQGQQRLVFVELLQQGFNSEAINSPDWYHPAVITGEGRLYLQAKLSGISLLTESEDIGFIEWLSAREQSVQTSEFQQTLVNVSDGLALLPDNYPAGSAEDEQWTATRQQLAQLALYANEFSKEFQVSLILE